MITTKPNRQRGSALVTSLVVVAVLTTVVAAAIVVQVQNGQEATDVGSRTRAHYAAETGVSETLISLSTAISSNSDVPQSNGSKNNPKRRRGARFWADISDNQDGTYTITSKGRSGRFGQDIQAVVRASRGLYHHAIFAGNSGADSGYTLNLGGTGAQADQISGDIFSGGDVLIGGDAAVTGSITAGGAISGATGTEGALRRLPSMAAMNYASTADVLVADEFAGATYQSGTMGGSAWEMPENNPAHIFRKNPSDRSTEINGTAKDDYFLEDPYEPNHAFTTVTGGSGHAVTVTGASGNPGQPGTDLTYFIDGNLWLHSKSALGYRFEDSNGNGTRVTLVVKGNIYYSDDLELENATLDGVAMIALKDENEPDSGNIYLGDPRYGTLEHVNAFLYAENNFYDNNLNSTGSAEVTVVGNMTAGNQVAINRDYVDASGQVFHSKLQVDFDSRVADGTLDLPSLPEPVQGFEGLEVVFWSVIDPE